MKRYLLLILTVSIITIVKSQTIDYTTAQIIAKNTILEKFSVISPNQDYKISSYINEAYNNNTVLHIFNLNPTGFIIISGDRSSTPVLAFSTQSNYNSNIKNPAAKFWIDSYKKQINYNITNNITPLESVQNEWDRLNVSTSEFVSKKNIKAIEPLLHTTWDQGRYYNNHCPEDPAGTDGHVAVGCVATALGQLMNYFRYPTTGTSSYGYNHPEYGWIEINFAEQTYDYDQMPIEANEYNDNLAKLLYNIGVSVDMNYGPDGSGMWNHKGAYTLYTYFGYDSSTTYLFKDSLPVDFDWNGTLVNHLDQKIPLYYAGWSDYEFISGHAFILDGYIDSTHYHINWGWGGSYDGYFSIDDLTIGSSDFTLLHEVIINATPISPITNCSESKILSSFEGTIEDGSGPFESYQNNSECTWLINPEDSVSYFSFEIINLEMDNEDYIIVFDGEDETAQIITTIYGDSNIETFESSSDKVLIKFVTNEDSVNNGWLISYSGNKPSYCNLYETITEPNGTISDGSNSYNYHDNTMCLWSIQPEETENIKVTITELDIEPINDYLKIQNSSSETIANISGNEIPAPFLIEGDKITITFHSDGSNCYQGFKLDYESNVTDIKTEPFQYFNVYPNPVTNFILIPENIIDKIENIKIYSIDGKLTKLVSKSSLKDINQIYCQNLKSGIYIIEIIIDNNIKRYKFVKE